MNVTPTVAIRPTDITADGVVLWEGVFIAMKGETPMFSEQLVEPAPLDEMMEELDSRLDERDLRRRDARRWAMVAPGFHAPLADGRRGAEVEDD